MIDYDQHVTDRKGYIVVADRPHGAFAHPLAACRGGESVVFLSQLSAADENL